MSEADQLRLVIRALNDLLFSETGKSIDEVFDLAAQNDRFRAAFSQMIAKLESGDSAVRSAFCSYCQERWPQLDGEKPEIAISYARKHATTCSAHPVGKAHKLLETAARKLRLLVRDYPDDKETRALIAAIEAEIMP